MLFAFRGVFEAVPRRRSVLPASAINEIAAEGMLAKLLSYEIKSLRVPVSQE